MKLKAPYGYDTDAESLSTGQEYHDEPLTQQHMKDEADINVLVERFGITGYIPTTTKEALVGDFTDIGDFQTCLNRVREAEAAFMGLPAAARKEFDNDAGRMLDYLLSGETSREELERLGLAIPQEIVTNETGNSTGSGSDGGGSGA